MKFKKGKFRDEFDRDVYWGRLYVTAPGSSRTTIIFLAVSTEYLEDNLGMKSDGVDAVKFDAWIREKVMPKWEVLGSDLFNQDVHLDVYATDQRAEQVMTGFLISKLPKR